MHGEPTDAELGVSACAGDVQALATLLERCRPSLYGLAVGLLGDRSDALDAVQDTSLVALVRLQELHDPKAARAWLHSVARNHCLMRLRRRREVPLEPDGLGGAFPGPDEALDRLIARDWVWQALEALPRDEREAVLLRYFTRCDSYAAIARLTAVPVGTVRSRLNRARTRLADALTANAADPTATHAGLEATRRDEWHAFYGALHEQPLPRTYRELFAPDIDVRDTTGHWVGIRQWSAHERTAITVGVRATIVTLLASRDLTVLEIDFTNPVQQPHHCPRHATFVHRLDDGRSRHLRIHYPTDQATPSLATTPRLEELDPTRRPVIGPGESSRRHAPIVGA